MNAKLTLKLNKLLIEKAKKYAWTHKKSLSKIVELYLQSLITDNEVAGEHIQISPFIKTMSTGIRIPSDLDLKKEFADYIHYKYKQTLI
jgi:hypothetical protein